MVGFPSHQSPNHMVKMARFSSTMLRTLETTISGMATNSRSQEYL